MMIDPALRPILDFLWYGFLPSKEKAAENFEHYKRIVENDSIEIFERTGVNSAKRLLCQIIEEKTIGQGVREVALGVTAGLDSRGLLGALLEIFPAKSIIAFTYGHKGTDDYDLARSYTKQVLPAHHMIDSVSQEWETEASVRKIMARPPGMISTLGEMNGIKNEQYHDFGKSLLVHGFLGDALSGKKLPRLPSGRWIDALDLFARSSRGFKGPVAAIPADYDPTGALPSESFPGGGRLLLDDQIQFTVRQEQRIRAGLNPSPGRKRIMPYDDPRWVRSFFLLPVTARLQQLFYKRFLVRAFPKIFPDLAAWREARFDATGLPAAAPTGAAAAEARGPGSTRMHVDFDHMFYTNASFRQFCRENLVDLQKRGIIYWLDLEGLLRDAEAKRVTSFGRLFYTLGSLEINFKAGRLAAP